MEELKYMNESTPWKLNPNHTKNQLEKKLYDFTHLKSSIKQYECTKEDEEQLINALKIYKENKRLFTRNYFYI